MDPAGARILDSRRPLLHGLKGGFVLAEGSDGEIASEAVHLVSTRIARITAQSPVIAHISVQPGFAVFVFAGGGAPHTVNGQPAGARDLLLLGAESETVHRTPGPSSWFGGAVLGDALASRAAELGGEGLLPGEREFERVSCSLTAVWTLRRAIRDLLALGAGGPIDPETADVAEELVLDQVAELIAVACVSERSAFGHDAGDQDTLRLVREHLEGDRDHQFTVAELCAATFTSERALRELFIRVHGVRPKRYLMMRQLTRFRAALQVADPDTTTTEQAAAEVGLHLTGRLAAEYRLTFRELPSETLKRASRRGGSR
jgi:AraC-like DNA-binding protein